MLIFSTFQQKTTPEFRELQLRKLIRETDELDEMVRNSAAPASAVNATTERTVFTPVHRKPAAPLTPSETGHKQATTFPATHAGTADSAAPQPTMAQEDDPTLAARGSLHRTLEHVRQRIMTEYMESCPTRPAGLHSSSDTQRADELRSRAIDLMEDLLDLILQPDMVHDVPNAASELHARARALLVAVLAARLESNSMRPHHLKRKRAE